MTTDKTRELEDGWTGVCINKHVQFDWVTVFSAVYVVSIIVDVPLYEKEIGQVVNGSDTLDIHICCCKRKAEAAK
jgi:hypothetical protein